MRYECEQVKLAQAMFTTRAGVAPPDTHSSIRLQKLSSLEAKQMVHLMQSSLEGHVDPAPRRRLNVDGTEAPATARDVREALDRGVPASRLFPFNRTLTASEVDFAIWDERWKPVVGHHRSPQTRPSNLVPPAKRPTVISAHSPLSTRSPRSPPGSPEQARSSMGLDHQILHPNPLPPPAYTQPTTLLKDPQSLAKKRASKAAAAKHHAKLKAQEQRQATRVAHRLPKAGEQWQAEAHHLGSSAQRSGVAAVTRRWSKPRDTDTGQIAGGRLQVAREQSSSWSLRSAPVSARGWQQASGYISAARSIGTACDAGSDLLDQMLGTRSYAALATTRSAPELARPHNMTLPPLSADDDSRQLQYRHHRRRSPCRPEQVLTEVMGAEYTPTRSAKDWAELCLTPGALKPRTPRQPSPPPDAAPELWHTIHSELSSYRGGLGKKANVSFREGELAAALRHLCDAIHAQHKVEQAAEALALATNQAPKPETAEATAKLNALRALFFLRCGDTQGALKAAQCAITAVKQDLGDRKKVISHAGAMAHYRKASALHIKSAQGGEMDPKGTHKVAKMNARLINPRQQAKWEALKNITAALRHAPGDRRFKALFNRLWREAHTEFGYSTFHDSRRSIPEREDSESEESASEDEGESQKRELDDAWRYLDLFDLFDHNQVLHEATTRLLGDGGDDLGDASTSDLTTVLNLLRRTNITPADMKRAEKFLKGKTLPLEPEARELLRNLRPLDAAEDHKKLIDVLQREQGYLRIVFRQYCLEDQGDMELLGLNTFRIFCNDIKLVDKRPNGVSKQTIDTIFTRANRYNAADVLDESGSGRNRPGGLDKTDAQLLKRIQPGVESWRRNYELNAACMRQSEFIAALIRCAFRKFAPGIPPVHQQLQQLFDQHIMPHAGMPTTDDISELLRTPEMRAFFSEDDTAEAGGAAAGKELKLAAQIRQKFDQLCKLNNKDNHLDSEAKTVNMETFQDWVRERGLLTKKFTAIECRRIFVRVNLDDELYEQEENYDTPAGLTLDEFQESLVRMCVELVDDGLQRDENGYIDVPLFTAHLTTFVARLLQLTPRKTAD